MTNVNFYNDERHLNRPFPPPRPPQPQFNAASARDLDAIKGVYDACGNMRYKVILSSQMSSDNVDQQLIRVYEIITLYNNLSCGQLCSEQIARIPDDPNEYLSSYDEAISSFDSTVSSYQALLQAEVHDFVDIQVYKDRIGYRVTTPDCCINCKFCKLDHRHECGRHHKPKYKCTNPSNIQQFNAMIVQPAFPCGGHHPMPPPGAWQKLPWQKWVPDYRLDPLEVSSSIVVYPIVEPFGLCDNFISLSVSNEQLYMDAIQNDQETSENIIDDLHQQDNEDDQTASNDA